MLKMQSHEECKLAQVCSTIQRGRPALTPTLGEACPGLARLHCKSDQLNDQAER